MGSKSKNKDRDRERSPTGGHKKKHKRRGSRSPENEGGEKHKKSKKSKHRHHDRESESPSANHGHREASGGESPSILAEDGFLAKSTEHLDRLPPLDEGNGDLLVDEDRSRPLGQNALYERRTPREFSPLGEEDIVNLEKSVTPPPPRKVTPDATETGNGGDASSLSIEETNRIRAKLGLKPLEVPGAKKNEEASSGGLQDDIHAPASNIGREKEKEKIKEKLELIKEKRKVNQKLSKVKGLADSDSDDEILSWVAKSRKAEAEKKKAAERAKMLDEMDDEFGVGKIVEEETQRRGGQLLGNSRYTSANLTGLKVDHDQAEFTDEHSTILTLRDADVLENEDGDVLMNVNIAENERTKKNLENKRLGLGTYKAYDDGDVDEYGQFKDKQILDKYDEELEGPKKESFQLGRGGRYDTSAEAKMAEIRRHVSAQAQSLDAASPTLAAEYLSKEEMTFKKKKRRVRKVRQRGSGVLTADDLLAAGPDDADHGEDLGNRRDRGSKGGERRDRKDVEEDGGGGGGEEGEDMELDRQEIGGGWSTIEGPEVDLSGDADFDDDRKSFERAMSKARKLKSTASTASTTAGSSSIDEPKEAKVAEKVRILQKLKDAAERKKRIGSSAGGGGGTVEADGEVVRQKGEVMFNATSEFFRVLGELPTYGQSGNRDSDEEDQLDFEREAETEKKVEEGTATGLSTAYGGRGIGTWNEVDDDDEGEDDASGGKDAPLADKEMAFMEEEPSADKGIAGALQLAMKKGYVMKEEGKKATMASARAKEDLTSQNYSIEDKNMRDMDDKYSNRRDDRYNGPTSKFSEKEGYKPNVKLEYVDDYGNPMSQKEAFRFLSHKFHGKGSGKMKTEKRNKKLLEVESIKKMASGDTPLGTMKKLKEKQKAVGSAYVTLSGGKSQAGDLKK